MDYLKEGSTSIAYPARKVLIAMQGRLRKELDRLENIRIIEKVEKPTKWVNAMALVEKEDGGVRLSIDPADLNKAINHPYYPIPTFKMELWT